MENENNNVNLENNKEKKNNNLLIIIVGLVVLVLIGYLVCTKFINKDTKTNDENKQEEKINTDDENKKVTNKLLEEYILNQYIDDIDPYLKDLKFIDDVSNKKSIIIALNNKSMNVNLEYNYSKDDEIDPDGILKQNVTINDKDFGKNTLIGKFDDNYIWLENMLDQDHHLVTLIDSNLNEKFKFIYKDYDEIKINRSEDNKVTSFIYYCEGKDNKVKKIENDYNNGKISLKSKSDTEFELFGYAPSDSDSYCMQ